MKHWYTILKPVLRKRASAWLLAFMMGTATILSAANEKAAPAQNKEDLANLQQLLKMPKEDLQRVRLTLEAIEKMSPADRKNALQHIQNLNKMPTEQRKETIERWNELSPELKKAYFDHLRKLPSSDRTKFKALPWDKQVEEVKKRAKK